MKFIPTYMRNERLFVKSFKSDIPLYWYVMNISLIKTFGLKCHILVFSINKVLQ